MSIISKLFNLFLAISLFVVTVLLDQTNRYESSFLLVIVYLGLIGVIAYVLATFVMPSKVIWQVFKSLSFYIWSLILVAFVLSFVFVFASVSGESMQPTVKDKSKIIVYSFLYQPKRDDIVVVHINEKRLIKRIVALPGDKITFILEDEKYYLAVNDIKYVNKYGESYEVIEDYIRSLQLDLKEDIYIKEDQYFVLGDNASNSEDSRSIHVKTVSKNAIKGKAIFSYLPKFGGIS